MFLVPNESKAVYILLNSNLTLGVLFNTVMKQNKPTCYIDYLFCILLITLIVITVVHWKWIGQATHNLFLDLFQCIITQLKLH